MKTKKENKTVLKEVTGKVNANNSILFTLSDTKNETYNFVLPLIDFETEEDGKNLVLILQHDFSIMNKKIKDISKEWELVVDYHDS